MKHYESKFKNKIVYCNCDDPTISNFYKYFATNFEKLGLKKLIASCYVESEINLFNYQDNNEKNGFYYIYNGEQDEPIIPTMDDVIYFESDGDFRSKESIDLLIESDVIVTNPPFSLFRDFLDLVTEFEKEFLIIGNINAITYKNVFSLIKKNKAWLGVNMGRGISGFIVPDHYELYGTELKLTIKVIELFRQTIAYG